MGFDTSRFRGEVNADLICSICSDVLEDPVQRTACEHYFCRQCITSWIDEQEVCPIDRQPLTFNDLKDVPRLLKSLLEALEMRCEYAFNGCRHFSRQASLESHERDCPFDPNVVIKCGKGCGGQFTRRNEGKHSCVSFLLNQIENRNGLIARLREDKWTSDKDREQAEAEAKWQREEMGRSEAEAQKLREEVCRLRQIIEGKEKRDKSLKDKLIERINELIPIASSSTQIRRQGSDLRTLASTSVSKGVETVENKGISVEINWRQQELKNGCSVRCSRVYFGGNQRVCRTVTFDPMSLRLHEITSEILSASTFNLTIPITDFWQVSAYFRAYQAVLFIKPKRSSCPNIRSAVGLDSSHDEHRFDSGSKHEAERYIALVMYPNAKNKRMLLDLCKKWKRVNFKEMSLDSGQKLMNKINKASRVSLLERD